MAEPEGDWLFPPSARIGMTPPYNEDGASGVVYGASEEIGPEWQSLGMVAIGPRRARYCHVRPLDWRRPLDWYRP